MAASEEDSELHTDEDFTDDSMETAFKSKKSGNSQFQTQRTSRIKAKVQDVKQKAMVKQKTLAKILDKRQKAKEDRSDYDSDGEKKQRVEYKTITETIESMICFHKSRATTAVEQKIT